MNSVRAVSAIGFTCAVFLLALAGAAFPQRSSAGDQGVLDDANMLRSQGEMAQMADEPAEAERLVRRSIDTVERVFGRNHREVALFRAALGRVYRAQRRLSEAAAEYEVALRIDPAAGPPVLLEIGEIALEQNRLEVSKAAFVSSLKIPTSDTSYRQRAYGGLGSVEFRRKAWRDAAEWWSFGIEEAVATLKAGKLFRRQSLGESESAADFSDEEAGQFYGYLRSAYRAADLDNSLREAMAARAFEFAQFVSVSRAGEAISQMAARFAPQSASDPTALRERQDLSARWRSLNLSRAAMRTSRTEADPDMAAANAEMRSIDDRLAAIDRQMGDRLPAYVKAATPGAVALKDVRAALRGDETLLFIITVPVLDDLRGETYLWAVNRDRTEWLRSDIDDGDVDEFVDTVRCGADTSSWTGPGREKCERLLRTSLASGSSPPFDARRSYEFYARLFSKSQLAKSSTNLLVVARGALTKVPLHLLVAKEPRNSTGLREIDWLVRTKAIAMLPTVSSLVAFRSTALQSKASRPMIGFGNPLLTGHPTAAVSAAEVDAAANEAKRITSCALIRAQRGGGTRDYAELTRSRDGQADIIQIMRYQPLPETAGELCAVADYLKAPADDVYLAGKATESNIKELSRSGELEKYRVLYFATHGVMASRLRGLSEPGLLLTPPTSASSDDDGYLSASEIASLRMNADWVVLSACNTAAGATATDEPLSGIAQAFFYAKARALLVSHWNVDSSAAVSLTTAAFRHLAGTPKVSRAEALRRSMVELLDADGGRYAHPRFWGAFAFVGDPAD